jgi:hypothetical protein
MCLVVLEIVENTFICLENLKKLIFLVKKL